MGLEPARGLHREPAGPSALAGLRRIAAWLGGWLSSGLAWPLASAIHLGLNLAIIFPLFYEIHPADEIAYLYSGRSLMNGLSEGQINLVPLGRAPLVMALQAAFYAPVHASEHWVSFTAWGSRFFLFGLLWLTAYLIGRQIRPQVDQRVYLALVFLSPAIPRLLENSSDALFAAMSGLALWQFLVSYRSRKSRHLAAASVFIGLAALSRVDGFVLFAVFLLLVILNARQESSMKVGLGRTTRQILYSTLPAAALILGYVVVQGMAGGASVAETKARTYFAFEQAEGVAYSLAPEAQIDGVFEARRLYGTPEENEYSVVRAVQNNPLAFARRVVRVPLVMAVMFITIYGGSVSIAIFVLAIVGGRWVLTHGRRSHLHLILVWPVHLLIYVAFLARAGYLLTPFFAILALSALGIVRLGKDRSIRQMLSVGILAAVLNAAVALALGDDRMLAKSVAIAGLSVLVGIWIAPAWKVRGLEARRAGTFLGWLVVFSVGLVLSAPFPGPRLPQVGTTPEERASVYLAQHFPRHAVVAAHLPAVVFQAKMNWQPLVWDVSSGNGPTTGRVQDLALDTQASLMGWLAANKVDAIYLDDLLWHFRPELYALIEQQIGSDLVEVFAIQDGDSARANYFSSQRGFSVDGSHRILVVAANAGD